MKNDTLLTMASGTVVTVVSSYFVDLDPTRWPQDDDVPAVNNKMANSDHAGVVNPFFMRAIIVFER